MVQFDLLPCHHRHTPGICGFVCSWWSTHHPRACRKRQFPIPELLINLIYVFWGYIFSRAKLISINFFKIDVLSLILIKLALSYLLLVCALNNPVAISMSKILGNNCYWNMWHPLYIICNWWPVVMWWVFYGLLSGCR